jgi:hypothetical protein
MATWAWKDKIEYNEFALDPAPGAALIRIAVRQTMR